MNTIGLDIGTSSVKALLVAPNGEVLKVSCPEYPFQTPQPLWSETDASVWWDATLKAIRELLEGGCGEHWRYWINGADARIGFA